MCNVQFRLRLQHPGRARARERRGASSPLPSGDRAFLGMVRGSLTQARQGAPKREKKKTRSSLASRLTQDKKEGSKGRLGGAIAAPQLSKSALRRQKHRQRDQLAGNQEGLRDLADELTTLEDDIPEHKDEEESVPRTAPGTITAKSKRRMLYVTILTQHARAGAAALYPVRPAAEHESVRGAADACAQHAGPAPCGGAAARRDRRGDVSVAVCSAWILCPPNVVYRCTELLEHCEQDDGLWCEAHPRRYPAAEEEERPLVAQCLGEHRQAVLGAAHVHEACTDNICGRADGRGDRAGEKRGAEVVWEAAGREEARGAQELLEEVISASVQVARTKQAVTSS